MGFFFSSLTWYNCHILPSCQFKKNQKQRVDKSDILAAQHACGSMLFSASSHKINKKMSSTRPFVTIFQLSEPPAFIIYFTPKLSSIIIFIFLPPLSLSCGYSQQETVVTWPSVPTHFSLSMMWSSSVWYQFGWHPSPLVLVCIIACLSLPAERER